ncbi:hypothetical protein CHS0354_036664 [Potamilus streckersoni]|uniref:Uncharacterized protein n=1 Tax=Potamilus streckersoni TaxID=2493646 RepID=A0AAE0WE04_9BIVA|nr:hypothetical protein CHS0354_036664 [Potamilus streckersoni]
MNGLHMEEQTIGQGFFDIEDATSVKHIYARDNKCCPLFEKSDPSAQALLTHCSKHALACHGTEQYLIHFNICTGQSFYPAHVRIYCNSKYSIYHLPASNQFVY